ncbi:glycosyltransferase [Pyrinomonas methylaliphatogenes]|uniref:Glycosyltransferase n=1 Tax=Pyrinomonas methylaliphatogenes TaxID=454194 RepID=A0A0B6WYB6_9BACT|nr:glycosyltransferase [Pyrinomonas methylaliphatogenes]CDM66263.1 glycosyltransferase [Pyrinomonas methylaliphatogenes]
MRSVTESSRRVFIYLETMPQKQGSGASLRFYSNIQAYLDLGFEVELIHIASAADESIPSDDLRPISWVRVPRENGRYSLLGRLMFRVGFPYRSAMRHYFPYHDTVAREFAARYRLHPEAIHQFEGESLANIIPWVYRRARVVWSLHDLPSAVVKATAKIACEIDRRPLSVAEKRELRFSKRAERLMARRAPLILCISAYDRDLLRSEIPSCRVEYLPMSIPGDGGDRKVGNWMQDGRLHLLHLGRLSHLPSYRSLEFLFENVFPLLPPQVLDRIAVHVVGKIDDDERSRRVLALASAYKNVSFIGFVEDITPYYKACDLQLVASTDAAGLRTRIIESFAYGLPVLSTSIGARGIAGLQPNEHLLIADDAEQFVAQLSRLLHSPNILDELSRKGRDFYVTHQSRAVVASTLAGCLSRYFGIRTNSALKTCPHKG